MDIMVSADGLLTFRGERQRCALGRNGVSTAKQEGDGATPVGCFPLRRVYYRPDRLPPPATGLPICALQPNDGWCDDPADAGYNRPVRLPYPARAETMWREDGLYDVVVVLGYNDSPPVPGKGSAIFLHVSRPDWGPTEGCVALPLERLVDLLGACGTSTRLCVKAPEA